ncbi:3-beta hydroxysteroid dehydrogenase [cyanobacterium TDX16]|nr:3-beta hydroxysteroid dehydrogenase [cyanobacterium TDX16]
MSRRCLVTGGGGFLGRRIVEMLLERGESVRILARGDYPELAALGVDCRRGDITDADLVSSACRGCDVVFHVAAKAGVWGRYEEYHLPNVIGTQNVIDACRSSGVGRMVHTSSPSVVFSGTDMEGVNESVPYARHYAAPYPRTKAVAEQLVLAANDDSFATTALRPHLIWGPRDNHLVPRIVARASSLRRIGGLNKKVDCVYIDNAASAHILAADRLEPGSQVAGKAYFISQGEPRGIWDLVNGILAAAGKPPVEKTIPIWAAMSAAAVMEGAFGVLGLRREPRLTRFVVHELTTAHWFDISAAGRDFGYRPEVSIDEGLRRLAEWFRLGSN